MREAEGSGGRWWESLPVRLSGAINLVAIVVLGLFWISDYRRTQSAYYAAETRRLREEAQVLRAAQVHFGEDDDFRAFVDTFCQQMDVNASPGHHIAVFDAAGDLVVRAHERPSATLEAAMLRNRAARDSRLHVGGDDYVAVAIDGAAGTSISVVQSLAPIRKIIRDQGISRAASFGILASVTFVVTNGLVLVWVHAPLRRLVQGLRSIGEGQFDTQVRVAGSTELRYVASGLNEMAVALQRADRERRQQMKRARAIQTRLLPSFDRNIGGYQIDAEFQPAESVGGDFYDIISLSDGALLVTMLDVSGHGVAAALHTALLRTVLRYETKLSSDPGTIATAMNREFCAVSDTGEFATCCIVRLCPDGAVAYANAGHDPPLLVGADGSRTLLEVDGMVLGLVDGEPYSSLRARLDHGSRLYLYTDGLHEVVQANGELVGRDRVARLLSQSDEGLDVVTERVKALSAAGLFDDDVTLVRIQRT